MQSVCKLFVRCFITFSYEVFEVWVVFCSHGTSQLGQATFQVLNDHMGLVVTVTDSVASDADFGTVFLESSVFWWKEPCSQEVWV